MKCYRSLLLPVLFAGFLVPLGATQEGEGQKAPGEPLARGEVAERFFRGIRRALQATPRDHWAVDAVHASLQPEPAAALDWVVQHTGWVPYEGILRGPKGVLMDRLGNDWDRALLLAALCEESGWPVRFVQAKWTEEALELAKPTWDWGTPDHLQEPPHGALDHFAREARLSEEAFQVGVETARWRREQAQQETRARVRAVTTALREALALEGLAEPAALPWPSVGEAHVWVQVAPSGAAEGPWIDLDPIHREAAPGHAWLEPEVTWSPKELPADLYRTVRLSAVAEAWTEESRNEVSLVSVDLRTMDAAGESIEFITTPLTAPARLAGLAEGKDWQSAMLALADGETEWLPTFVVHEEPHYQLGIRADGSTIENPNQPAAARAAGKATSALEALGSKSQPKQDPFGWTALWIQIELLDPGSATPLPASVTRRPVFDWIGPAVRAAQGPRPSLSEAQRRDRNLRMLGSSLLCLTPCDVPTSFLERLYLLRTWQQRELWQSVAEGRPLHHQALEEELRWVRPLEGPLWGYQRARLEWNADAASYLAAPNLVIVHQHPILGAGDAVELQSGYDVVWNPRQPWPGAPERLVRLQQGIADTATEARLLEVWRDGGVRSLDLCAQKGPWTVLRTAEQLEDLPIAWNADGRARLAQDLGAGAWCVVPVLEGPERSSDQLAYWRIDPRSGTCLGMGGQGWGAATAQEFVETAQMVLFAARTAAAVAKFAQCMHGTETDAGATVCTVALLCRASTAIFAMLMPGPMAGVAGATCGLIE